MSTEYDELQSQLAKQPERKFMENGASTPTSIAEEKASDGSRPRASTFCQWEIGPNDSFMATGATQRSLPSGVYRLSQSNIGIVFTRISVMTDKLIDLKDTASSEIIQGIRTFWASGKKFDDLGILYKRGVLLWGPPGSGKTVTVALLVNELLAAGGLVILCEHPEMTVHALAQVRRIEPDRRLIVVEEDIEELMRHYGEHALLSLLDGENQIANVVHIATTNYVEELGARIVNRPSRFDEVKKIGMPNAQAAYFEATVPKPFPEDMLYQWVRDTEDMSIAHLRELVVAVYCLSRDYEETIERLRKMQLRPKSHEDGFNRREMGLRTGQAATACAPAMPR